MKLDHVDPPFNEAWTAAYLIKNRENRKMICLCNGDKRTTIAYARYLMAVKLGRMLTADEQVDHIDNDKTNDAIENLQILAPAANRKKYRDTQVEAPHGTYRRYKHGCRCDACIVAFREYQKAYYHKHHTKRKEEERVYSDTFLLRKAIQERLGRDKKKKEVVWMPDESDMSTLFVFASAVDFNRFVKLGYDTQKIIENADHTYSVRKEDTPVKHYKEAVKPIEMECEFCHKHFMAEQSSRCGEHIYCSKACFAAANKGKPGKPRKLIVDKDQLLADLREIQTYTGVGLKYGVTGNTIKKRCKIYGIYALVDPIIKQHMKDLAIKNNPMIKI